MANEEQVSKLREGVEVWNQWRQEHPDIRPDLEKADLRHADLGGADLDSTILDGADLGGATLLDADLSGANIRGASFDARTMLQRRAKE
jgi:hypothetical protein